MNLYSELSNQLEIEGDVGSNAEGVDCCLVPQLVSANCKLSVNVAQDFARTLEVALDQDVAPNARSANAFESSRHTA